MLRETLPPDTKPEKDTGYTLDGMLIVRGSKRGRPYNIRNPDYFNLQQKTDACALYCVYGSLDEVSSITSIPKRHLETWQKEPWWAEIQKRVYVEQNQKLASRITVVLDKSLDHVMDRLEHGDYLYDVKRGELKRKPVDLKVLGNLLDSLITRRQLLRGEPTQISSQTTVDDRLKQLAEQFARFSNAKEITVEKSDDKELRSPYQEVTYESQNLPTHQADASYSPVSNSSES